MNVIDELLLKTGKGIYCSAIKVSKEINYGAITTLLLSRISITQFAIMNSPLILIYDDVSITFSKISVPSFNACIMQ